MVGHAEFAHRDYVLDELTLDQADRLPRFGLNRPLKSTDQLPLQNANFSVQDFFAPVKAVERNSHPSDFSKGHISILQQLTKTWEEPLIVVQYFLNWYYR
jgi:hypothetical protein